MGDLLGRIRLYRQGAGLTIQEAARRAGMHRVAWSAIENGRNTNPKLKTIMKIARGIGVTPTELAGGLTQEED